MAPAPGEVTKLLRGARDGNQAALDEVMALMYDDLRALARRKLGREFQARTLEPTALVHEAYFKMMGGAKVDASDRAHLLAIASRAMRQVLVDRARRRTAAKRADAWKQVTLTDAGVPDGLDAEELLSLDDALAHLEPRQRQIVECRFFGGMTEEEVADALGITERTVRRDWIKAKGWLVRELEVADAS